MKSNKVFVSLVAIILIFSISSCKNDNDGPSTPYFRITTSDIDYDGYSKELKVYAPFSGSTYVLNVEATSEVVWSVTLEDADGVTVSPEGEFSGNGEIIITVEKNEEKLSGKGGIVSILNSIDNVPIKINIRQTEKELFFPNGLHNQSTEDFYNESSKYNVNYMIENEDVAVLWEKDFGKNPMNAKWPFEPEVYLNMATEAFNFITGTLKFASLPNSKANKYKLLVFVPYTDDGGCTGGGIDPVPIIFQLGPAHYNAIKSGNGCIVYHEMGHSFQFMAGFDGAASMSSTTKGIYEMTSQWTLLQKYPDWINRENYHFVNYIDRTHFCLGHDTDTEYRYCAPYMLEYWSSVKHDQSIMSRLFQSCKQEDLGDFMRTYMRVTGTSEDDFREEVYDAASRFITWDLPHIAEAYARYGGCNVHECKLKKTGELYQIHKDRCPQNYGYNGICLNVPAFGTTVQVNFKGLTNISGYNIKNEGRAEWKWGFLAVLKDGSRVYGEHLSGKEGELSFKVPENTEHLWLIVAATPTPYFFESGVEWPYQFTLKGTTPDGNLCEIVN